MILEALLLCNIASSLSNRYSKEELESITRVELISTEGMGSMGNPHRFICEITFSDGHTKIETLSEAEYSALKPKLRVKGSYKPELQKPDSLLGAEYVKLLETKNEQLERAYLQLKDSYTTKLGELEQREADLTNQEADLTAQKEAFIKRCEQFNTDVAQAADKLVSQRNTELHAKELELNNREQVLNNLEATYTKQYEGLTTAIDNKTAELERLTNKLLHIKATNHSTIIINRLRIGCKISFYTFIIGILAFLPAMICTNQTLSACFFFLFMPCAPIALLIYIILKVNLGFKQNDVK